MLSSIADGRQKRLNYSLDPRAPGKAVLPIDTSESWTG